MLASILVAAFVGMLVFSTVRMRRRERRHDSITRFADARRAMSVSQGRPAVRPPKVTPHETADGAANPDGSDGPSNVVVRNGSATLLDPIARRRIAQSRRSFRSDPEVLARRPTVAMLPTLLTGRGAAESEATPTAKAAETSAVEPPVVALPAPQSEAS